MEVFDGRVKMSLPCPMIRQRKWTHFDGGVKISLPCPMIRQNDVLKCHYHVL